MKPSDPMQSSALPEIRDRVQNTISDASQRLGALLSTFDPVELFTVAVISNMFYDPETITEVDVGTALVQAERLAYEAYPRFGTDRAADTPRVTFGAARSCNDAVEDIVQASAMSGLFDKPDAADELEMLLASVRHRAEIVRGSAYPPQTERRIQDVQGSFDSWFAKTVGIAPSRACAAVNSIVDGQVRGYNERVVPELLSKMEESKSAWASMKRKKAVDLEPLEEQILSQARNPAQMQQLVHDHLYGLVVAEHVPVNPVLGDAAALTHSEWDALVALVGMTAERRAKMRRPLDVRHCPLYVLPDGRALVADLSTTLEALWGAYEQAARGDQAFYQQYQTALGKWLEGRTEEALSRLFPNDCVYSTLDYPDIDKGGKATTELDGAVLWGPFLILVEAKAKQFRLAGQINDTGRLRTDLQRNLSDAFSQALRAQQYVEAADVPTFKERGTGRSLVVDKGAVRKIYLVTVSAYELGTLTTQLARLAPLGLFKNDDGFPFAVSEGDLDVIADLLPGPEAFVHYLERRTSLHASPVRAAADEIDLLGAYLLTRLVDTLDFGKIDADGVALSGLNDDVDRWVRWKWTGEGDEPQATLAMPDGVSAVLASLRDGTDDAKQAAVELLGFPRAALESVSEGLRLAREDPPDPGRSRVYIPNSLPTAFVLVASNRNEPVSELEERLRRRVRTERYRRRSGRGLGVGIHVATDAVVDVAVYEEGEWVEDPHMEALLAGETLPVPLPGSRLPGRNAPCFCGSGNKFKRCCGPKLGRAH